jgi:drug/metabolite transporter (DMT)-like permease
MEARHNSFLAIHLAVLLFGLAGLFAKVLLLSPLVIVAGRTLFASLALGSFLLYSEPALLIPAKKDLGGFVLLGVILAVHWATFFHSIQISTVAVGLLTFSSFPVFVTFLEPYFFKERMRLFDVLTAFLVFGGLILVVPSFDFADHITRGAFWGTLSGLTFAFLSLLNRRYVRVYSPSTVAFCQNAFAALLLSPFFLKELPSFETGQILLLALLGVLCTALAHALFIRSLRNLRAQLASITAALEPVYGVMFAVLLLGEIPRARTVLGGCIIVGTTVLASLKPKSDEFSKKGT